MYNNDTSCYLKMKLEIENEIQYWNKKRETVLNHQRIFSSFAPTPASSPSPEQDDLEYPLPVSYKNDEFDDFFINEEELNPSTSEEEEEGQIRKHDFFEQKINKLKKFKKRIEEKLAMICCHQFVQDYIDLSPETSKEIIYCPLCETLYDDWKKIMNRSSSLETMELDP